MLFLGLAGLTATAHLAFIIFLIVGGPLGRRLPRLRSLHLGAIAATVLINLTRSPCPLTVLEKDLLGAGGRQAYEGGFISHYLVEPVYSAGIDGTVNLVLLAVWIIPTALAYLRLPPRGAVTPQR